MLASYLISCPHGNAVGCFVLPYGYVCEDLGWDLETVRKLFGELFRIGFVTRDESNFLTQIVPWWEHNTVENPNVAKGAVKDLDRLPKCQLLQTVITVAEPFLNRFGTVVKQSYEPLPKPFRNIEPKPKKERKRFTREDKKGRGSKVLTRESQGNGVDHTDLRVKIDYDFPFEELPNEG